MQEGELFRIETLDWTGGQIGDNDSADDVKTVDLTQARRTRRVRAAGVKVYRAVVPRLCGRHSPACALAGSATLARLREHAPKYCAFVKFVVHIQL